MRIGVMLLIATVFGSWMLAFAAGAAEPGKLEAGLARLSADSFSETDTAIGEIAASGAPTAFAVLEAAAGRRLYFSPSTKGVFYKDGKDQTFDALTGEAATAPPTDLSIVRLNNRLRGAVEAALGGLLMQAPEPAKRIEAANSVFKSRDAKKLPAIDAALASEKDEAVKAALLQAKAAILVTSSGGDEAAAVDAIGMLKQRGDQDAVALLQSDNRLRSYRGGASVLLHQIPNARCRACGTTAQPRHAIRIQSALRCGCR